MEDPALEELANQQYQRLYWESDVPVKDIRSGMVRMFLVFSGILFVAILLASMLLRFPDQIELPFVLKAEQQETVYKFPFPVFLEQVFVSAGDTLAAGTPLVKISSPEIVQMIHALNDARAKESQFDAFGALSAQKRKEILYSGILRLRIGIQEQEQQLDALKQSRITRVHKLTQEWTLAAEQVQAYRALQQQQIGARSELIEKENSEARALDALRKAEIEFRTDSLLILSTIQKLNLELQQGADETAVLDADTKLEMQGNKSRRELALQQLRNSFGPYTIDSGSLLLLAPLASRVSYLFEGEKEIKAGVTLIKLSGNTKPGYAFVKCPPAMAGKIQSAGECHLKIASFPFYEWGVAHGALENLSLTPDENGQYNASIRITDPGKLDGKLFAGLTGTAVLILEEHTLFQYFFRNTRKHFRRFLEGDFIQKPSQK